MKCQEVDLSKENIEGEDELDKLFNYIRSFEEKHAESQQWIFRGKHSRFNLKSGLERVCEDSGISPESRFKVEAEMMREFKRWYDGVDRDDVRSDDLYCLSLMQHFGAPTRLLDWTYSKYVALYFALESARDDMEGLKGEGKGDEKTGCTVWCLNTKWCKEAIDKKAEKDSLLKSWIDDLGVDKKREAAFRKIFRVGQQDKKHYELVCSINPLYFHSRLYAQQAVFLCPCDVSVSLEKNLESLPTFNAATSIVKINCELDLNDVLTGLETLWRMNISRATLFPGLEGFAKSMAYRVRFLEKLYDWRTGAVDRKN